MFRIRFASPAAPRRLPVVQGYMAPYRGKRDETCARYSACLLAHVKAYQGRHAMCPRECRWREAMPKVHPHAYASSGVGNMEVR